MTAVWHMKIELKNNEEQVQQCGLVTTKDSITLPDVKKIQKELGLGEISTIRSVKLLFEVGIDNLDFVVEA